MFRKWKVGPKTRTKLVGWPNKRCDINSQKLVACGRLTPKADGTKVETSATHPLAYLSAFTLSCMSNFLKGINHSNNTGVSVRCEFVTVLWSRLHRM